jgi:iron(III) transport system ATP-binding protein
MSQIVLSAVSKRFRDTGVLQDVDLTIERGAFVALLGPSGCGKTTLLRLIAGLERPSAGEISIGGRVVAGPNLWVEPEERRLGMVFQSYALWPHMTVSENVAFGLRVRNTPSRDRSARVERALKAVGLDGLGGRKPAELSGGQRQRAALARCLVLEPDLILLDEPLANLDAHLRLVMQSEFRRIHRDTGSTFIFVTHDQVEAMALADQVAIMDKGRIEQFDTPQTLYGRPATPMVARFFGKGAVLPIEVLGPAGSDHLAVRLGGIDLDLPGRAPTGPALLSIRPEHVGLPQNPDEPSLAARVIDLHYRGEDYRVSLVLPAVNDQVIELGLPFAPKFGDELRLRITGGWVLPAEGKPA